MSSPLNGLSSARCSLGLSAQPNRGTREKYWRNPRGSHDGRASIWKRSRRDASDATTCRRSGDRVSGRSSDRTLRPFSPPSSFLPFPSVCSPLATWRGTRRNEKKDAYRWKIKSDPYGTDYLVYNSLSLRG